MARVVPLLYFHVVYCSLPNCSILWEQTAWHFHIKDHVVYKTKDLLSINFYSVPILYREEALNSCVLLEVNRERDPKTIANAGLPDLLFALS